MAKSSWGFSPHTRTQKEGSMTLGGGYAEWQGAWLLFPKWAHIFNEKMAYTHIRNLYENLFKKYNRIILSNSNE